ncbi:MAG: acyl-CoA thioesterase [Ignavibacteria bacterium]|jgi:YbgC/YbaW family acyl-CoA thioester hydrolase|nr:acyl-CoA thioesterase [Ignavibacteria bacterium]
MSNKIEEISKLLPKFKFKNKGQVYFHEVDIFKVVHNLKYLFWTENARVSYCNHLGIGVVPSSADNVDFSVLLAHSSVTYFSPAHFLDKYIVYTRVKTLGNSSMEFEHVVTLDNDDILLVNNAIEVYVDLDKKPMTIPNSIRNKIIEFEKEDVILKNGTL